MRIRQPLLEYQLNRPRGSLHTVVLFFERRNSVGLNERKGLHSLKYKKDRQK